MNLQKLHHSLLAALGYLAAAAANGAEINGTVRQAGGDAAKIVVATDLVPNVGDKVDIYFKIPGGDDEVVVAKGKVTEVTGDSVSVTLENAAGTVAKDQLARFTSDKPAKKTIPVAPVSPTPPAAAATTHTASASPTAPVPAALTAAAPAASPAPDLAGRGPRILVFDHLVPDTQLPGDALAFAAGRVAELKGFAMIRAVTPDLVLPAGRTRVLSLNREFETSLTLVFDPPLTRFSITRVGVIKGASLPTWRLASFDAGGRELEAIGEIHGLYPQPRTVALARGAISQVVLTTDNRNGNTAWATYNGLPIAQIEMER